MGDVLKKGESVALSVKSPRTITSRSAIYRIGAIHKEISMGAYPNASDLGEILEVSYKTVLRDIKIMREQFDFPIAYDPILKGFYYDISDEQNQDILYWNSIFARFTLKGDTLNSKRDTFNSAVNALFKETDPHVRALLEVVVKIITLGGCVYIKKGFSRKTATPLYCFKRFSQWFLVLTLEVGGSYLSVDISKCKRDGKSSLLIDSYDADPLAAVAVSMTRACQYPKSASLCMCSKDGILHTCSAIKESKVIIFSGEDFADSQNSAKRD